VIVATPEGALLGYEVAYAWAVFGGISLMAAGFAMDLLK
jgi:hypothetical protein